MKKINILIIMILTISYVFLLLNTVDAHETILNIQYDDCQPDFYINSDDIGDGINEVWYYLCEINYSRDLEKYYYHLPQETKKLKYYFAETSKEDSSYRWDTDVSISTANEIKDAFSNSMKQWNDVYFYSYDSNGRKVSNKVIEIEEGKATDYDIIIYPERSTYSNVAGTSVIDEGIDIPSINENIHHTHYYKYEIRINISYFHFGLRDRLSQEEIDVCKTRSGAHEIGHILGLDDVDECCNEDEEEWHHEELLMGYANNRDIERRQLCITYKDLAGVAITRGFHTDNDHDWLNMGLQQDGRYKFVCSICNGVIYDAEYYNYLFYEYGECNNIHTLESNNMYAVGRKGNMDFVKCKYCRYIMSVENMIQNDYTYQISDSNNHITTNHINNLNYILYEGHNYTCTRISKTYHKYTCICGYSFNERHCISLDDYNDGDNIAICIQCNFLVNLNDGVFPIVPMDMIGLTINGSFVLNNEIIVLAAEDIENYYNRCLVFRKEEELVNDIIK